jgi:hypothetical protein
MRIFKPPYPNHVQTYLKDAEQLLAPFANRVMPLPYFKPGKYQQQNEAALQDMQDDFQYGEKAA